MTSSQSSPAAPIASRARAWRAANSSAGKSCLDMLLPPYPALSPRGRGMRGVSVGEAGDGLLFVVLDGGRDMGGGGVAGVEHVVHLICVSGSPELYLATLAVGFAHDGVP